MKNVKLADIWDHYNKTHTLTNLRFVIAGKITPNRQKIVKALIESLDLPKGSGRPKLPHEVPKKLTSPLFIKNTSVDTIYFYIDSFLKRKLTDTEVDALGLANTMLTETLYSKILGTARERGLVYGLNSGYGQSYKSSNWWFGTQVMQENIGPLFEIIKEELTKVFNGELANDDVAEAKQYSLGRFQRSAQTVAGIMSGYSNRYFFDGVIEDYYQVPDRIKKIEKDTIIAVSRAMFEDGIWGLGILGNINEEVALELRNQLKSLWRLK